MNKRGQQIFGMSFGMIFSIILIIFFIVGAWIAIKIFWNPGCECSFSDQSLEGIFKTDLQAVIDDSWNSAGADRSFKISLPSKITYLCFMNYDDSSRGEQASFFKELKKYTQGNAYLYPPKCACSGFRSMTLKHINITQTVKSENPLCIANGKEMGIRTETGGPVEIYKK